MSCGGKWSFQDSCQSRGRTVATRSRPGLASNPLALSCQSPRRSSAQRLMTQGRGRWQ